MCTVNTIVEEPEDQNTIPSPHATENTSQENDLELQSKDISEDAIEFKDTKL